MAKKKKAKSLKKVTKKTPLKKAKKKTAKKVVKKATAKSKAKKAVKKATKKNSVKKVATKGITKKAKAPKAEAKAKPAEAEEVKKVKKPRKKRITKAETLRLMKQEQLVKKWHSLYKKLDQLDAAKYNMREAFSEETAISHVKLGWGFILSNTNDRLEVLFEDGIKNLISNYKSR